MVSQQWKDLIDELRTCIGMINLLEGKRLTKMQNEVLWRFRERYYAVCEQIETLCEKERVEEIKNEGVDAYVNRLNDWVSKHEEIAKIIGIDRFETEMFIETDAN